MDKLSTMCISLYKLFNINYRKINIKLLTFTPSEKSILESNNMQLNESNKLGKFFYEKGEYKKAIKYFEDVINFNDTNTITEAYYYKGQSMYVLHKYMQAISCFQEVIVRGSSLLINYAYYYKGNCLYSLKKYKGAIECYTGVSSDAEFKICANLYRGFCYEELKQYNKAEEYFYKVIKDNSSYYDLQNIQDIGQRALKLMLIKQGNVDKLLSIFLELKENIDLFDSIGNNLLIYATSNNKQDVVTKLLNLGANPFKGNKFGNSAFSTTLRDGNEDLAKKFVNNKISDRELVKHLSDCHYIISQISKEELQKNLGFNSIEATTCFEEARYYCETESLGKISSINIY